MLSGIRDNATFIISNRTSKKKEKELKDAIAKGQSNDIIFIIESIDKHNAGLSCHSSINFLVTTAAFAKADVPRVAEWLESIGFKENTFGTYYLSLAEVRQSIY